MTFITRIRTAGPSVIAALLVVTSLLLTGVSPAAAADGFDPDCSELDEFVWVFTIGMANADKCDSSTLSKRIAEMQAAEQDQAEIDIYQGSMSSREQYIAYGDTMNNYGQDMETIAWTKAEVAMFECFEAGGNNTTCTQETKDAVDEYYSVHLWNLGNQWNNYVAQLEYLDDTSRNESLGRAYVVEPSSTSYDASWGHSDSLYNEYEYTLPNGTDITMKSWNMRVDGMNLQRPRYNPLNGYHHDSGNAIGFWIPGVENETNEWMWVSAKRDRIAYGHELEYEKYRVAYNQMESSRTNLKGNLDLYVPEMHEEYINGNISASEGLSTATLMSEYGIEYENSSYWLHAVTALSGLGLDTPNLNSTGVMTVEFTPASYNNTTQITKDGFVMARNAPGGGWEAGTTYNASNITGPVMMVTTDGGRYDLAGEFTISAITNTDGESVETVETTKYVYETTNSTEYQEKLERLLELRLATEERFTQAAGGGGGDSSGWDFNLGATELLVLAGAAALLLLGRQ